MAAPTESRTPHWHLAKIAHTRVRMEGWRQRRLGCTEKIEGPKKERYSLLTRIGLLMEGLGGRSGFCRDNPPQEMKDSMIRLVEAFEYAFARLRLHDDTVIVF